MVGQDNLERGHLKSLIRGHTEISKRHYRHQSLIITVSLDTYSGLENV